MRTVLLLLFLTFSTNLLSQIEVSTNKSVYNFEEKVTINYKGLNAREQYSGRSDEIIIVEVGSEDAEKGIGLRTFITKGSGEEAFMIYKPGTYEARIYIYEQPGKIAARSVPFGILALEEGDITLKSDEHLSRIASRHFREDKPVMCKALNEFFRRKPTTENPYYNTMKLYSEFCVAKPAPVKLTNATPLVARYICYRLLSTGPNEVTGDLYILPGNKYKIGTGTGSYTYSSKTRHLNFQSGPFKQSENWVGVYTAKGEPIPGGGAMAQNTIEIRRKSDMDAGNMRVMQQCSCVK